MYTCSLKIDHCYNLTEVVMAPTSVTSFVIQEVFLEI